MSDRLGDGAVIRWQKDEDGIVVLILDDPNQSANTMTEAYKVSMGAALDRLTAEIDDIAGVIITSAKNTFFAGGDLRDMVKLGRDDSPQIMLGLAETKSQLRRLETLGKPVVAAINGAALGGGLEIALACHHRIAADVPGSRIGLPEVSLGLLPGGGGITRTVRLLGIQNALMQVLLQGQRHRPAKAREIGIVDDIVPSVDALIPAAKQWIKANPESHVQPWDAPGYSIPGGSPNAPELAATLPAFAANLRKQVKGANMPAPRAILAAAVEGAQVDFDNASLIESRYFVELLTGPVAKNMIQAFFFDMQSISKGGSRPAGFEKTVFKKVSVLGAGMMGAGIGYVCAQAGIDVVLKDVSLGAAEKGKAYAERAEAKLVAKSATTSQASQALLDRIHPTADAQDAANADLVIEAVFEDTKLKHTVFQQIEDVVDPDALLGSNTSTLPITSLAAGVKNQANFIGLHFFSPVEKMPLVEIIRGEQTSNESLAKAIDFVMAIRKTPIVVNDSRGFFTSRVIGTFGSEAIGMVAEGIEPALIEQAGMQAGYPAAPLQLCDELNLNLYQKVRKENEAAAAAAGQVLPSVPADGVVDRMVGEFSRPGRVAGAGFYEYVDGKRTTIWPGLREAFNSGSAEPPLADLIDRLLFIEAIEAQKCLDEGVVTATADANIGSILGIGYPAWTGGVIQFIVGYPGGQAGFVARARQLAARYGDRFDPPASLTKGSSCE